MRQALKLYTTIRKNQFIMAAVIGMILIILSVGSFMLIPGMPNQDIADALGPELVVIWLIIAIIVFLNDQSRRLDTWLYTQNISRGQLFLTRVILLVVLPIMVANVVDIGLTAALQPHTLLDALNVDITVSANIFFMSSLFVIIATIIGPNWLKAAGTIFTLGLLALAGPTIKLFFKSISSSMTSHFEGVMQPIITMVVALFIFAVGHYLAQNISDDTVDEAVRVHYLKWPIVIFVFIATLMKTMSSPGRSSVNGFLLGLVLPIILAIVTFIFVFKPTFKVTWDK
ncbi:permease [Leuconostoc gelidum subsp. aenigmaticum]|uniref:permease n=1 Tax=Leuconostoc gelidum TaxID=1244 RepID=UPI001CC63E04|nr:permease [Leuconostoc gelidum subsp. aenigmaticum]MBZ6009358.1 permease [Leuconostoc gelidum subsp. aenigmaticum]